MTYYLQKLRPHLTMKSPTGLFMGIVVLALLLLTFVSQIDKKYLLYVDIFTAKTCAAWTDLIGMKIVAQSNKLSITMAGITKDIIIGWGCDGLEAYLILISAILPFPCKWRYKWIGLLGGLCFVFVMNQIRLIGLIYILFNLKDVSQFGFYHTGVGQIFALVMIFGFWMIWVNKTFAMNQSSGRPAPARG